MRRISCFILGLFVCVFLVIPSACSTQRKLSQLKKAPMGGGLKLPREEKLPEISTPSGIKSGDTLHITGLDGKEVLVMKATRTEDGGLMATEQLEAAVVTARFRNVAERNGQVDLEFQILVSDSLQDNKWQLRFNPVMYILADTVNLDPVIITGDDYRKYQVKGYQQYQRFLDRIARDSLHFVDIHQLEIFIERNIPALYAYRNDSTYVTEDEFKSTFGVTEQEALEHFTNHLAKRSNAKRISRKDKMFARYVKSPIQKEGIRLDTVIHHNGQFEYNYIQTIHTRAKLRKVDIVLKGEIFAPQGRIYSMAESKPLTFYISSLSSFVDDTPHYKTMVIERRAEANASYNIAFAPGKSDIDTKLSRNTEEIQRIKTNLRQLSTNKVFDLDSIIVTASSSPEGGYDLNTRLSMARSQSVTGYFRKFITAQRDSLEAEMGFSVDENGKIVQAEKLPQILLTARNIPEAWDALDLLVAQDTVLTDAQKETYRKAAKKKDLDARDLALKKESFYPYMLGNLYPQLRTVSFNFHLHRKGMVKDTVHTTVLDTLYMDGVQAIRDRDFERAISILSPYKDYNSAVAFLAMDRNTSARLILEKLPKTATINYMLAVIYSREGDDQKAVQHYMHSCEQEPSYVHRGNLDPEISALIKRYNLNAEPKDDFAF